MDAAKVHPAEQVRVPASSLYNLLVQVYENLSRDDLLTHAAALAFYVALALAPLFVLLIVSLGFLNMDLNEQLLGKINSLIGEDAAKIFRSLASGAQQRSDLRNSSSLIAFLALVFSSSAIFGQMETSFNWVLRLGDPPPSPSFLISVLSYIKTRIVAAIMILAFISIIIVSLSASLYFTFLSTKYARLYNWLNMAGDLVVFVLLFTAAYKFLPRIRIDTKSSLIAGAISALLFIFGKYLVSAYINVVAASSTYGAAGLPIALFIWLFYSSFVILLGAEIISVLHESKH